MDYVAPKSNLGTTVVAEGQAVGVFPQPLPGGEKIVSVKLTETCALDDLNLNASAPPNTDAWKSGTLKGAVRFPLDQPARGRIVQELDDRKHVVVEFDYVSTMVSADLVGP